MFQPNMVYYSPYSYYANEFSWHSKQFLVLKETVQRISRASIQDNGIGAGTIINSERGDANS